MRTASIPQTSLYPPAMSGQHSSERSRSAGESDSLPGRKESNEPWDQILLKKAHDLIEAAGKGKTSSRPIAERYARQEFQVWVELSLRGIVGGDRDYLVVCERSPSEDDIVRPLPSEAGMVGDVSELSCCSGQPQLPMFVDVVEVIEDRQELAFVPSVVRLYSLDGLKSFAGDVAADAQRRWFLSLFSSVPHAPAFPDRKPAVVAGFATVQPDQLEDEVIERAPEVVDTVASDGGELRSDRRGINNPIDMPPTLVLYFADELVGVLQLDDRVLKVAEVALRSVHLDTYALQRGWLPAPLSERRISSQGCRM